MFFGNEKRNRKSCSEEKKVRGKIVYFYGLESGLGKARRKTFRVARRFIGRRRGFQEVFVDFSRIFLEFFAIFLENFYNFLENFYNFLENFYNFLENFPKIFAIFFNLCDFLTIFPKILAHNPLQFNRGLAIIVSLQVSLQVGLHLSLHLYL